MRNSWLAALCLIVLPVNVAVAADRGDAKVVAAGEAETAHREFVAYGEWVLELDRAVSPAMNEVRALGPQWQAAINGGNYLAAEGRFLPLLASAKRAIADARLKLDALPRPDFPTIDLPPEARTPAVHAEMVRTLGQLDGVLDTFPPVLKALARKDIKAAEAALVQMLGSARTMFRAQETMSGVWMATLEAGDPGREAMKFEQLYFRSASRLMTATEHLSLRRRDPAFGADVLRIADEIDGVIAAGNASIETGQAKAMAVMLELGTDAEGRSAKAMLTKSHTAMGMYRDTFAIAGRYSAALRATAKRGGSTGVTLQHLQAVMVTFRATREELDAVGTRQAEVMAGTR
ncbi:MAG: hypothetical protein EOP58_04555 [Sphingomonadales bacterium]|nr:MAG: hypothetical protein EOP58_04555 [Sphingomonadales bacterium]